MPQFPVTLSLDTSIYASGDVLADTQLVSAAVARAGAEAVLDSVKVEDDDDQGIAFDLVFLKSNTSLGTENAGANISDANVAAAVVGILPVAAADFVDLGGARVAHKTNLNLPLWFTGSLYVAAVSRGTGTYTASGIKLTLGFRYR